MWIKRRRRPWVAPVLVSLAAACAHAPDPPAVPAPESGARSAAQVISVLGRLRMDPAYGEQHHDVHVDAFELAATPDAPALSLPPLDVSLITDGDRVIPVYPAPVRHHHPHWEWWVRPGALNRVGDHAEVSLPVALVERGHNCTHNGSLNFSVGADGTAGEVAWRVSGETCQYLQLDLRGRAEGQFDAGVPADAAKALQQDRGWQAAKWPTRPLTDHRSAFPGLDLAALRPADLEHVTTWGLAFDGVHYRGDCPTRDGAYPFCNEIVLPSYSTAKALFAGLALMFAEQRFPGFRDQPVSDWVPECAAEDGWHEVTIGHLLDMSSGRWDSTTDQADENALTLTDFFVAEDHATRTEYACTRWPRQEAPGTTWVYHTSDTYIAGTAMQAAWRAKTGGDLHRDFVDAVYRRLSLSEVITHTRRTRDEVRQPLYGWGLFYTPDDLVRLVHWLMTGEGRIEGEQVLDARMLAAALQRDPAEPGLRAAAENLRYHDGFYAYDLGPRAGCDEPLWVPFLSGYGGISVVLLPNDVIYYVFRDDGRYRFADAAVATSAIRPLCNN